MISFDPETPAEADYLYFGEDMDSQGVVRPMARGTLAEVLRALAAEAPHVKAHIYVTIGERQWSLVDGERVEGLRSQYRLHELAGQ